jgi:predicted ATPase
MTVAQERHDTILRSAVDTYDGYLFSTAGDGLGAAFGRAGDALAAAVTAQAALAVEPWPPGAEIRVRMGLHTGECAERRGDYFGSAVNRAARLMAGAHGGQVVVSDVTAGLVAGTGDVELVDLGSHRLRGLLGSCRVFGVKAEGLDWVDRPLATAEARRGNLPRPATEWFGSVEELKRRAEELDRRRLVTLTGPGGMGKTRLAIELGAQLEGEFADGVWMVELGPLGDPEAVFPAAAATLGVSPQPALSVAEAITSWLEEKRLLLIVDNCEHLLASATELVSAALAAGDSVRVVATSREPLGIAGEQVVLVASLDAVDGSELFEDRARLADASFEISGPDRETVAAICEHLDGIPLAIELAAARVRSMTPGDLLARLGDRFKVLRGGGRGGVERHRTLHAALGWSYHLLSEAEQAVFDRLSVFAGGFDLVAAEAVCADVDCGEVLDVLSELIAKSLVMIDRSGPSARYRLLETLRQYGEERLDERAETAVAKAAHLRHYVAVAQAASGLWASPRALEAATVFDREWDNLRVAHAVALEISDLDSGERLLSASFQHANFTARIEHPRWARRTIRVAEISGRPSVAIYGYAARFAWSAGDYDRSLELAERGIAAASRPDDPSTIDCWISQAASSLMRGRMQSVQVATTRLKAVLASTTDDLTAFWAATGLAIVAGYVDRGAVRDYTDRAGLGAAATGAPTLQAMHTYLEGLALSSQTTSDLAAAADAFRRAIEQSRAIGATPMVAITLSALVAVVGALDADEADNACREAITTGYESGFWSQLWLATAATAAHLAAKGDSESATVIVGYLEANQPGRLDAQASSPMKAGPLLQSIRACGSPRQKATGAAMSRSGLVDYMLSALPAS